jgi:ribonuclease HI
MIYVDASFKKGGMSEIAWFNETTGKSFHEKRNCLDSFRCEYEAIIRALEDNKDAIQNDVVTPLTDNETVANQLNHTDAINKEDIREMAFKIWGMIAKKNVTFLYVPREKNKAGKILGS